MSTTQPAGQITGEHVTEGAAAPAVEQTAQQPTPQPELTRRPALHFAPRRHFMNDPNGLVFFEGRYHLFFQHNPHGDRHGNMSWGHATSTDLLTWTEHEVALWHDDVDDVFSGSVVIDTDNTTGWSTDRPALVAIYTAASRDARSQRQALARSTDGGTTWTRYEHNPVLDLGTDDFRDPKVFRHQPEDGAAYWVMVAVEAISKQVVLYRSGDLKAWTRLSSYGPAGAVGGNWECPDLFALDVVNEDRQLWVMLISLCPGSVAGGSGTQYVVGDFDGTTFTPLDPLPPLADDRADLERAHWLDWGRDCYAGVTYAGLPADERVLVAWMSNWDYAQEVPTSPWRGAMTLPRRLRLRRVGSGYQLEQTPVLPGHETERVRTLVATARGTSSAKGGVPLVAETALPGVASVRLRSLPEPTGRFTLTISDGAQDLVIRYDAAEQRLVCDRRGLTSFHPTYASTDSAPLQLTDGALDLHLVVDATSVEVFAGTGQVALTTLALLGPDRRLQLSVDGGAQGHRVTVEDLSPTTA